MSDWYQEQKAALEAEQAGKPREEVIQTLQSQADYVFDPDTAVPKKHNWKERGLKMTCEGADHPYHEAWKRRSPSGSPM